MFLSFYQIPVHAFNSWPSPAPIYRVFTVDILSFNIRYRYNTLLHILANEFEITKFYPANRLDRLTSGIILIAQNPQVACEFERLMKGGSISKSYYCRVNGEFPEGKIKCDEPIKTFSFKLGLNHVHPDGKLCSTDFERVSFNGTSSLVKCQPLTGRTHQIRVHLLHLGYPIANDPLYKLTDDKDSFICELAKEKSQRSIEESCGGEGWTRCDKCQSYLPPDPSPKERLMWLHAFCYSGPDWSYTTKDLPDWAQESYKG
ncbi:DRAP deaminase [Entomophthora muscae]|uniref:DRAP deaminase n=1 Tax=Entomophthora muscae TaxID=34485 RepID=A0ACC2TCA9_9FUNG|nr:DRAP deaminase [Entomophthora muscae]